MPRSPRRCSTRRAGAEAAFLGEDLRLKSPDRTSGSRGIGAGPPCGRSPGGIRRRTPIRSPPAQKESATPAPRRSGRRVRRRLRRVRDAGAPSGRRSRCGRPAAPPSREGNGDLRMPRGGRNSRSRASGRPGRQRADAAAEPPLFNVTKRPRGCPNVSARSESRRGAGSRGSALRAPSRGRGDVPPLRRAAASRPSRRPRADRKRRRKSAIATPSRSSCPWKKWSAPGFDDGARVADEAGGARRSNVSSPPRGKGGDRRLRQILPEGSRGAAPPRHSADAAVAGDASAPRRPRRRTRRPRRVPRALRPPESRAEVPDLPRLSSCVRREPDAPKIEPERSVAGFRQDLRRAVDDLVVQRSAVERVRWAKTADPTARPEPSFHSPRRPAGPSNVSARALTSRPPAIGETTHYRILPPSGKA
jgi:hypothetical protein